jgi:hypothetical protein
VAEAQGAGLNEKLAVAELLRHTQGPGAARTELDRLIATEPETATFRALRAAILEHRARTTPPGVAARFDPPGEKFYRFQGRYRNTPRGVRQHKPGKRLYVHSGATRATLLRRNPRRLPGRGDRVAFRLTLRGGALNFLSRLRPVIGEVARLGSITYFARAHQVSPHVRAGIQVSGYAAPARAVTTTRVLGHDVVHAAETWASQFGWDDRDHEWIGRRFKLNFLQILRRAAVSKKGRLKAAFVSRHLEQHDG